MSKRNLLFVLSNVTIFIVEFQKLPHQPHSQKCYLENSQPHLK
jgi:hypothetical protein